MRVKKFFFKKESKKCIKNTYDSAPDFSPSFFSHHFSFLLFYTVFCCSSFYFSLYIALANKRGASESHVKKGNRRLCCRAKDYENLFLSTQTIPLGEIVAHEASPDYGVWFLVIYLFIWDYEANSFYILLIISIFWKHFSRKYHFFLLCFQSIILVCGMCLINLDLKLVQQDDSSSKI